MTNLSNKGSGIRDWGSGEKFPIPDPRSLIPIAVFIAIFILYLATLAHTPVLGDPTEYTFVANILGIAHPPGYALITLLGKLFQELIPFGEIPWRMHLLSAVSGTIAAVFVFGIIRTYTNHLAGFQNLRTFATIAAIFGAVSVAVQPNHWQHSIHANPHIITGAFLVANMFFLTKWWSQNLEDDGPPTHKWLYVFCVSAGLGVAHHPLTVFGFPAYALFILLVHPRILLEWKTLLKMVLFALLGLSVWLYFPIRSPMQPEFGPSTMNTLDGFLDHVLARGLSDSLPYYSPADQPHRAIVFYSILRLQYTWPVILLALFGFIWPIWVVRKAHKVDTAVSRRTNLAPIILYTVGFACMYTFIISLKAQDIMAYILGPMLVVGAFAGIGLFGLLTIVGAWRHHAPTAIIIIVVFVFLVDPIFQLVRYAPLISLRSYSEGEDYVNNVFNEFDGDNAVLLNDWEHMTPLWYTKFVEERWPDPKDVRPEFISTGGDNPWLEGIFNFLPGGPVYLSNFRPNAIAGTEFRLRPAGPFYEVVEPGDDTLPDDLVGITAVPAGEIEIIGYQLPETEVTAGDFVPLTIAMRSPTGTNDYYVPVLHVGDITYEFTTDSHLISPNWWPQEAIIERFDFALPHDLPGGRYPVTLDVKNLSQDAGYDLNIPLGELSVTAQDNPPDTDGLLANFRQRVGLVDAAVLANGRIAQAPWDANKGPLTVQRGDTIHLLLEWESLAKAEESYTIFVHLIDGNNVPYAALDYTPLGGAAPTHLWIPKWLPGQTYLDPYRLPISPDLPPGQYFIEVGMYEMVNGRRLHISDENGNLNGDRYVLGTVIVE